MKPKRVKAKLALRIQAWQEIKGVPVGVNEIRTPDLMTYRKPGSQNPRK